MLLFSILFSWFSRDKASYCVFCSSRYSMASFGSCTKRSTLWSFQSSTTSTSKECGYCPHQRFHWQWRWGYSSRRTFQSHTFIDDIWPLSNFFPHFGSVSEAAWTRS
jgi:hypothetical protein